MLERELEVFDSRPPREPDDRLQLMFTCCHPGLNLEAQVALTRHRHGARRGRPGSPRRHGGRDCAGNLPPLPRRAPDLLRRLERWSDAAEAYRRALALCANPVESRFLQRRLDEVTGRGRALA